MNIFTAIVTACILLSLGWSEANAAKPKPSTPRRTQTTKAANKPIAKPKEEPQPTFTPEEIQHLRAEAALGNPAAQFTLGLIYEKGDGVPKSDADASVWYLAAAEQGYIDAQYNLAGLYAEGRGVPQDWSIAANWYRKAAQQNDPKAQYNLAQLYRYGQGVPLSETEALQWYRKAAAAGIAQASDYLKERMTSSCLTGRDRSNPSLSPLSPTLMAIIHTLNDPEATSDHAKVLESLKALGENNDVYAQLFLASLYAEGTYVSQNPAESFKWTQSAAKLGHPGAQTKMGHFYEQGIHVPQQLSEATCWYQLGAQANVPFAQYRLGYHLLYGSGDRNEVAGLEWLMKAAQNQQPNAQILLGRLYEEGKRVPKSHSEAFQWYRRAAETGSPEGQYWVAKAYQAGLGTEQNQDAAINWYRKAAANGDEKSAMMLQSLNIQPPEVGLPLEDNRPIWRQVSDWVPSSQQLLSPKPVEYRLSPMKQP